MSINRHYLFIGIFVKTQLTSYRCQTFYEPNCGLTQINKSMPVDSDVELN